MIRQVNPDLLDKPMPSNAEAERMILGCVLLDNSLMDQARASLKEADFFTPSSRKIYRAMLSLAEAGQSIDPIATADLLERSGDLEQVGGLAFVATLTDGVPRFSDIRNYVRIVREKSTLRQLIHTGGQITSAALDGEIEAREQLTQARLQIEGIADPAGQLTWMDASESIADYWEYDRQRIEAGTRYDGIALGFPSLDEVLWGLPPGTLSLVAARPGMGKTALLMQFAESICTSPHNSDVLVMVFSIEMPRRQLMQRMIGSKAGVPIRSLRTLSAWRNEGQRVSLKQAAAQLSELPILINETPGLTPGQFAAEVRRVQKENKSKQVVAMIDYVQQMYADGSHITKPYDRVTAISVGLMRATKDLGCVTIAAAQLSRATETRTDKRPTMADLRDSGQMEQDAAVIMFPHRPSYYNQDRMGCAAVETDAELIIGKGRFSGPGVVPCWFDPTKMRYLEQGGEYRG